MARRQILTILGCAVFFLWMGMLYGACAKEAQEHRPASNTSFDVELLFTVDGARVYRFYDGGGPHYFAVAGRESVAGRSAMTFSTESCGKNCTHEVEIQTVRR